MIQIIKPWDERHCNCKVIQRDLVNCANLHVSTFVMTIPYQNAHFQTILRCKVT